MSNDTMMIFALDFGADAEAGASGVNMCERRTDTANDANNEDSDDDSGDNVFIFKAHLRKIGIVDERDINNLQAGAKIARVYQSS